jgi:hypothetical protein
MKRFSLNDQQYLHSILSNSQVYTWFNDIPFVESTSFLEFIKEFNVTTTPTSGNAGTYTANLDYDHLAYQFYMILRHDWQVVDLTSVTGLNLVSMGEAGGGNALAVRASKPHWAAQLYIDEDKFKGADIVMSFHTDRTFVDSCDSARTLVDSSSSQATAIMLLLAITAQLILA